MSDESSVVAMTAASSLSDKVWELSSRTVQLFSAAAEVAADLQYCFEDSGTKEAEATARAAVGRIGDLLKVLASIRQQEAILRYFALAYKERLGGWYVMQDNGKSFVVQRNGDDRPLEVSPLDYRYQSYTDKALDLVDQLLDPLTVAGSDLNAVAAAVPYLLDLTFDPKLVKEFVAELRQEAVRAVELAAAEAGDDAIAEPCEREPDQTSDAALQLDYKISGLSGNAVSVLSCLQDRAPALLTLEVVAEKTDLSRDTVCKVLTDLIDIGLAHRPKGEATGRNDYG